MKRLLALVVVFVLAFAAPASAHVTVTAPGATPGGSDQEITFRVPVEKQANTIGFTVQLPTDTPIASVLVEPVVGWTHAETTTKLAKPIVTDDGDITTAVSQITWTATAGGLKPGEFGAFTIIAGQLPDTSALTFKAKQAYSDHSVVSWIQVAAPGSKDEPEFPAPVLSLTAASTAQTAKPRSTTGTTVLSLIALVLAAAALGLVVVLRAQRNERIRKDPA